MSPVRLYVAVASARDWKPQFGASAVGLTFHLTKDRLGGRLAGIEFKVVSQGNIMEARDFAMRAAVEGQFTHFFSLDDDMAFPEDTVDRLLAHEKPVVAANYCRKTADQISPVSMDLEGKFLDSTGKSGVEEVGWIGLGCALIDLNVVKQMPIPRFEFVWCEERQSYYDDSYAFSAKARQAGASLWVDHDLSQQVLHIGDYPYRFPAVR